MDSRLRGNDSGSGSRPFCNDSNNFLKAGSRQEVSAVRSRIAVELVKGHVIALADVARWVGVSTSAVPKIIERESH